MVLTRLSKLVQNRHNHKSLYEKRRSLKNRDRIARLKVKSPGRKKIKIIDNNENHLTQSIAINTSPMNIVDSLGTVLKNTRKTKRNCQDSLPPPKRLKFSPLKEELVSNGKMDIELEDVNISMQNISLEEEIRENEDDFLDFEAVYFIQC